jgi:hypothetical protein
MNIIYIFDLFFLLWIDCLKGFQCISSISYDFWVTFDCSKLGQIHPLSTCCIRHTCTPFITLSCSHYYCLWVTYCWFSYQLFFMTFKCTVYYNCFDLVDFHGWEKGEEFIKVLCHNAMQKLSNNMFTPEFGRFSFHN